MTLTCNRLMLLLALYRGSPMSAVAVGTFNDDVVWLIGRGLITAALMPRHNRWELTLRGNNLVKGLLGAGDLALGIRTTITIEYPQPPQGDPQ